MTEYDKLKKDLALRANDKKTPCVNFGGFYYVLVSDEEQVILKENDHELWTSSKKSDWYVYAKTISTRSDSDLE